MAETDITKTATGDFTADDWSPDSQSTDGVTDAKETIYQITDWDKWFGMYNTIPELKISIDAKSTWTVGKGFKANEITEITLFSIRGFGKDSFNSILANMIRTYHICGDAFAEIVRDPTKKNKLVNLKPLDPSSIRIIISNKGLIKRYEQVTKLGDKVSIKKFKPTDIFHLSRNRTADEVHGISLIPAVEEIILMRNEAMSDYKKLLHRNVQPVRIWHLDTDVASEITSFKEKVRDAKGDAEDIFIPKGAVETEIAAVPSNSTLNPLPWIQQLNTYFYQATSVPQVIVGGSAGMTEAAVKIEYLAFEQTIENEQLYIEEQILQQLYLEVNLEFPASLKNEMITDMSKEETMQATTPEDVTGATNMGISGVGQ